MPLPDAPDYSKRIYELLKETDLENLTYSQFQGVAEKLFIEPENEDEMRRLVLIQLARMAVRGDWDGFLSGSSGIGGSIAVNQVAVGSGTDTVSGSASFTYSSNVLDVSNQIELSDVGAAGILKNSESNQDLKLQVAGTGNIRIENQTTNTDSQLNVKGNGTGTPKLIFSNDTKAVTVQCDENQKIKVDGGGGSSFVFDASSATGGITFPDGTTQITAASGGGGTNNEIAEVTRFPSSTQVEPMLENLTNQGGSGYNGSSKTVASLMGNGSFMYYRPFTASRTGTLSEVVIRITGTDPGSSVNFAFYDSDANGNPNSLIGQASISTASSANSISGTITPTTAGDMDLIKGNVYYCGYGCSASSAASVQGHNQNESNMIGYQVSGGAIGTGIVGPWNLYTGPATPPATFSFLSSAGAQLLLCGGIYS